MQERDFKWFKKNHKSLFEKYGDVCLAIKNKKVLGAYATYGEAMRQTSKTEELGTFIVQKCSADEEGYTNHIVTNGIILF